MGVVMRIWLVTYKDGSATKALSEKDIWAELPSVESVVDLGEVQVPAPAAKPITMTDKQFRTYAAQQLGSASTVGAVWKAAKDSTDPDVQYAFMAWSKAQTYDKTDVAQLCSALVSGNCMTPQQRTALLNAWPEA